MQDTDNEFVLATYLFLYVLNLEFSIFIQIFRHSIITVFCLLWSFCYARIKEHGYRRCHAIIVTEDLILRYYFGERYTLHVVVSCIFYYHDVHLFFVKLQRFNTNEKPNELTRLEPAPVCLTKEDNVPTTNSILLFLLAAVNSQHKLTIRLLETAALPSAFVDNGSPLKLR